MQSINLLPWRDVKRKKKIQLFWMKLTAVIVILLILFGFIFNRSLEELAREKRANDRLSKEISVLNQKIKKYSDKNKEKQQLQQKIQGFAALNQERNNIVEILNLLPEVIATNVVFDSLSMQAEVVSIEGREFTNNSLTKMLAKFEQHKKVQNLKLDTLISSDEKTSKQFKLTFSFIGLLNQEKGDENG